MAKMTPRINLVKIGGIRLTLDYSWFIIFLLIFWSISAGYLPYYYPRQSPLSYLIAGFAATLLFFVSVIIHEIAHSLVAIRSGIKIPEITLFIFGGVSHLSDEPRDPKTALRIAVAGPVSSFALSVLFFGISGLMRASLPGIAVSIFNYLGWINIGLGMFNLLPGFPLDGGRVLQALWWWRTGSFVKATRTASRLGKGFAALLIVYGGFQVISGAFIYGIWAIFIGMFLYNVAEGSYDRLVMQRSLQGVSLKDAMSREVISVEPGRTLEELANNYFLRYRFKSFPVIHNNKLLGTVSLNSIGGINAEKRKTVKAGDVMTPISDLFTISPEAPLSEFIGKITGTGINLMIVIEKGGIAGVLSLNGLMRYLEIRKILGLPLNNHPANE